MNENSGGWRKGRQSLLICTLIVRERLFFCRKIQTYGRNSNLNLFFFGNTKEGFLVESLAEEVHHVKEDKARVLIHDKLKVGIDR